MKQVKLFREITTVICSVRPSTKNGGNAHQLVLPLNVFFFNAHIALIFDAGARLHFDLHPQRGYSPRKLIAVFLQFFLKSLHMQLLPKTSHKTLKVGVFRLKTGLQLRKGYGRR